jgi:uncharacterized protein (DUF2249 family)
MTSKEKVLDIYPDAEVWIMNEHSPYPMIYIQRWTSKFKWEYLARRKKTEEIAWETAWDFIQSELLRKLEQ